MNPTQTGIAVALALAVVIAFFISPDIFKFGTPAATSTAATGAAVNNDQTTTTMPTDTNSPTQLITQDEVVGTGAVAATGDTVTVKYVGTLTDGTVFDASANHPQTANGFTFTLGAGQVIQGWDQGIVGMKVGGKRKLTIPPSLAYGDQAVGNVIPANSTLVFEVELVNVQKAAK